MYPTESEPMVKTLSIGYLARVSSCVARAGTLLVLAVGVTVCLWAPGSAAYAQQPAEEPEPPAEERVVPPGLKTGAGVPKSDAADEPAEPQPQVEVVRATLAEAGRPGHRKVREVRILVPEGGRMDWSQQGDRIAFDRAEETGFYHIYSMRPDGTSEKCLTCENWDLRKTNSLSPAWHPSGEYLVFQVQQHANKLDLDTLKLTTPHRGLHSDLWVMTSKGRDAWQITKVRERGAAVVDPHFSHEAGKLVWSQRVVSLGRWGEWEPHVAEFQIKRGTPRIAKVRDLRLPVQKGYVVAHGFTPSDRGLLISAVPDPRSSAAGRDILEYDIESGSLERLTTTPRELDDLVFTLPRSEGIVWVSDRNIKRPADRMLPRRGDVWYMSASRLSQERLTFFNHPESDHFLGEAMIDDLAWSPEGDALLVHVVSPGTPGTGEVKQAIYIVEFDGVFGA